MRSGSQRWRPRTLCCGFLEAEHRSNLVQPLEQAPKAQRYEPVR
jgi:hypothetical protein